MAARAADGKRTNNHQLIQTCDVRKSGEIRLLNVSSIKDFIDGWVICDTGSADHTETIIKDFFKALSRPTGPRLRRLALELR